MINKKIISHIEACPFGIDFNNKEERETINIAYKLQEEFSKNISFYERDNSNHFYLSSVAKIEICSLLLEKEQHSKKNRGGCFSSNDSVKRFNTIRDKLIKNIEDIRGRFLDMSKISFFEDQSGLNRRAKAAIVDFIKTLNSKKEIREIIAAEKYSLLPEITYFEKTLTGYTLTTVKKCDFKPDINSIESMENFSCMTGSSIYFCKNNKAIKLGPTEEEIKIHKVLPKIHPDHILTSQIITVNNKDALLMTKMNYGTLSQPEKKLSPDQRYIILLNIIQGMQLLHKNGITHNDLCDRNIFLDEAANDKITAKIADFGKSEITSEEKIKEGSFKKIRSRDYDNFCDGTPDPGYRSESQSGSILDKLLPNINKDRKGKSFYKYAKHLMLDRTDKNKPSDNHLSDDEKQTSPFELLEQKWHKCWDRT